jgi:hypothetical protein
VAAHHYGETGRGVDRLGADVDPMNLLVEEQGGGRLDRRSSYELTAECGRHTKNTWPSIVSVACEPSTPIAPAT